MITEDYVSFETAKLLKEKGFDERPLFHYDDCGQFWVQGGYDKTKKWHFPAPTFQMAMKWLREVHNIFISIVCCTYPTLKKTTWTPEITTFESVFPDSAVECDTYEEACEVAIRYCLENLL